MEVFHVASMRAGRICDEAWKIQKACIKKFLQNFHATCKFLQNFKQFYEILYNMLKNFRKLSKNFTEFYKIFQKVYQKNPEGNSIFHGSFSIFAENCSSHLAAQSKSFS